MDDFEACIAHLRFRVTHRRAIRTTNLLERLFVEERHRLKIIPNAFGERAVLKRVALIRCRAMALDQGHRVRTSANHFREKRTRSGMRPRALISPLTGCSCGWPSRLVISTFGFVLYNRSQRAVRDLSSEKSLPFIPVPGHCFGSCDRIAPSFSGLPDSRSHPLCDILGAEVNRSALAKAQAELINPA